MAETPDPATVAKLVFPMPVRERICEYLKGAFEAVVDLGQEPGLTWETVVRAPLTAKERALKSCMSIQEGPAKDILRTGVTDVHLEISFEFEIKGFIGESPATFLNYVLAHIRKTLAANRQCGGLCLHVLVTGDNVDVLSEGERTVGGIVFATVSYRHVDGDPTRLIGE